MNINPFAAMQAAVDIVESSPHPNNKIAATLFGTGFSVSRTNHWPATIEEKIGRETEIGSSSGTIHAETACILATPHPSDGCSLAITDPFCPNCAKNIAEAGIKTIYIDHKGFKKDFFARRADQFETMSMQIAEKAGISVYELWRKDEKLIPIYMAPAGFIPKEDSPATIDDLDVISVSAFQKAIAKATEIHARRKFCLSFARKNNEPPVCLIVRAHAALGYSMTDPQDALMIESPKDKYSFIQEPVNRMLMFCARYGYQIIETYLYSSHVPTAREQVNLVGAGIKKIAVGDVQKSRDADGLKAMHQLKEAGIIDYS